MPNEQAHVPAAKPIVAFVVYSPFSSSSLVHTHPSLVKWTGRVPAAVNLPSMATMHENIFLWDQLAASNFCPAAQYSTISAASGSEALPKTVRKQLSFHSNNNWIPSGHTQIQTDSRELMCWLLTHYTLRPMTSSTVPVKEGLVKECLSFQ